MKKLFEKVLLCLFLLIVGPGLVAFTAALLAETLEAHWRKSRKN